MSEFKQASERDIELMRNFAEKSDFVFDFLSKFKQNEVTKMVAIKVQEACQWFNTAVMNGILEEVADDASESPEVAAVISEEKVAV